MTGKVFFDTNIFVCANHRPEPRKLSITLDLIRDATIDSTAVISYQVIQEFFNAVLSKSRRKMAYEEATLFLETIFRLLPTVPSSVALMGEAIRIQERYRLSWYDSLIVSAAQQAGCHTLYSEDLQHGQQFGPVTVKDPFR